MLTPTLAVLISLMHFLSVLSSRRLVLRHYTYTSKSIGLLALVGFEDEAVGGTPVVFFSLPESYALFFLHDRTVGFRVIVWMVGALGCQAGVQFAFLCAILS